MMAWVKIEDISLTIGDKRIIEEGRMLNDKHINLAQRMIKQKFPSINGLHLTLLQDKPHTEQTDKISRTKFSLCCHASLNQVHSSK